MDLWRFAEVKISMFSLFISVQKLHHSVFDKPSTHQSIMAKSDSFFIRAKVNTNGTTFAQTSIDLGAYVDALGKSVLRIHNIAVQYGTPPSTPNNDANATDACAFQLTTQSQTALVLADDKSLISSGRVMVFGLVSGETSFMDESMDVSPQDWKNGYLVGVEQIYLGVDQTFDVFTNVSIVLECTVETLSQNAAMALALSQQ